VPLVESHTTLGGEGVIAGPEASVPPASTAGLTDRLLATLCRAGQVSSRLG
jgi:hypothetical protein